MKREVTIKDIADELGIHHATVSRALKHSKMVSEQTRDTILEKAKEMGYKPNLLAQSFRNGRTNIIAVIVPSLKHHFFSGFVSDITELAYERGFMIMVLQSNDDIMVEQQIVTSLINMRIAGVAVSIGLNSESVDHFDLLEKEGVPVLFFDRVPQQSLFSTIVLDNYKAAYTIVQRMLKQGRERIAYLSFDSHLKVFRDRLNGYIDAITLAGVSYRKCISLKHVFIENGYESAPLLFGDSEQPDAIICVNDEVAIGVMKYLKQSGYIIPDDVSIVGFDDNPFTEVCDPELTTFSQSTKRLAELTFDLLLRQIDGRIIIKEDIVLPMELKIRGSQA